MIVSVSDRIGIESTCFQPKCASWRQLQQQQQQQRRRHHSLACQRGKQQVYRHIDYRAAHSLSLDDFAYTVQPPLL